MIPPITGQGWLIEVADAILEEPIINALFVDRADLVSVLAGDPLASLPAVGAKLDAPLPAPITDRHSGDTEPVCNLTEREPRFIERDELFLRGEDGVNALATGIPDLGADDAVLAQPVWDGSGINSEPFGDLGIAQVLDVDHLMQLFGCWLLDAAIEETATNRSSRNAVVDQPTPDFRLGNAFDCSDLARREPLGLIEFSHFRFGWSHLVSPSYYVP